MNRKLRRIEGKDASSRVIDKKSKALEEARSHHVASRLREAMGAYEHVLALDPENAAAMHGVGLIAHQTGRTDLAISLLKKAAEIAPEIEVHHSNLGIVQQKSGAGEQAVESYRRALAINPDNAMTHNNLGAALQALDRFEEAEEAYRRATKIDPSFAEAHDNVGNVLMAQLKPKEALENFATAVALKPEYAAANTNLLAASHYDPKVSVEKLFADAVAFGRHLPKAIGPRYEIDDSSTRKLKIGYVSPDLRQHPVGQFIGRALDHHDKSQFEIHAFATAPGGDALTEKLKSACDQWIDISSKGDKEAFAEIETRRIDILVDLSGHTNKNRLSLFALRPAPVQISYLGYWGTTGVPAMDYAFMDDDVTPEGMDAWYSERILRLPLGRFCWEPLSDTPEVAPAPIFKNGFVTFGSFNNLNKINERVVAVWSELLNREPKAKLLLKWKNLDIDPLRGRILEAFATHGIGAERLILKGFSNIRANLEAYGEIDVALDPFPFAGGATSCEALFMGVPVVTLPMRTAASRQTRGFLRTIGHPELIANSTSDYVELTLALARNAPAMANLRRTLRGEMQRSPLCDGAVFTKSLEDAYRSIWRDRSKVT